MTEPAPPLTDAERDACAQAFARIALAAGAAVMEVYASGCAARAKADSSPVTDADERAEAIILAGLKRQCPDLPVIAEESSSKPAPGPGLWESLKKNMPRWGL